MPAAARPRFTLYDRHGCHLCEQARAQLERLAPVLDFDVASVNVDADPALQLRYGDRVPVIALGDREVIAAPFGMPALRVALARALSG